MIRLLLSLALVLFTLPAAAEEVVSGLSQNRVSITTNFDGSEILIFGAVKRETEIPYDPPLEVIVAVEGPAHDVTVRQKSRELGIWVNTSSFDISAVPTFYSVSTTALLADSLSPEEDKWHKISLREMIYSRAGENLTEDQKGFVEALMRINTDNGNYGFELGGVHLEEETLFNTRVALPANLTEGGYAVRIFLTRSGEVVDVHDTFIVVQKIGLERWLYNLAHQNALIYGLLSLAIAIAAGWGASAFFRLIRD